MMSGAVEHHAQRHASTRDQALARLREIAADQELTPAELAEALAATAAGYLGEDCWYRAEALELLGAAGVDLARAERVYELRRRQRRIHLGDAEL